MTSFTEMKLACLEVEELSLQARLREASVYPFNADLQFECRLLQAQIRAIRDEIHVICPGRLEREEKPS